MLKWELFLTSNSKFSQQTNSNQFRRRQNGKIRRKKSIAADSTPIASILAQIVYGGCQKIRHAIKWYCYL